MKEHKHARVLRLIADGVSPEEFEVKFPEVAGWHDLIGFNLLETDVEIRRKERTHVVNGFTVPAPMDRQPLGDFYTPYLHDTKWYCILHRNFYGIPLKRGLCFATKEGAIMNAKAMCGIDPNKEE